MAGSLRPLAGWSLLSEAFSPGSTGPCRDRYARRGADTPTSAVSRRHRCHGDGASFWRPLAPRYGSDLLTLRLRSLCSWVTCFQAAQSRTFTGFAEPARSPLPRSPCAPAPLREGPFGGVVPPGNATSVLVCAVAAVTLWVTASMRGSKLPFAPDSAWPRFLIASRRTAPAVMLLIGHDTDQRSW